MDKLSFDECVTFLPKIDHAKCVKVYDGDTFYVGTILPPPYGATRFCCRLLGVLTPELRSRDEQEKALAREARDIVKATILHKVVNIKISGHDKYGRLLVRVSTGDCDDLSQHLVNNRVAVSYDGGKKERIDWRERMREHAQYRSGQMR